MRSWPLLAAALVLTSGCGSETGSTTSNSAGAERATAPLPTSQKLYIAGYDSNSVLVVDIPSHEVVRTIGVGKLPHGFAATPDGRFLWVAASLDGALQKVDTARDEVVGTYALTPGVQELAVSPDGRMVYTGLFMNSCYNVFDSQLEKVVAQIPVDGNPHNATRGARDHKYVYLVPRSMDPAEARRSGYGEVRRCDRSVNANFVANDSVYALNMQTNNVDAVIPVGAPPRPTVSNADGTRLYANIDGLVGFVVVDTARRQVIERVEHPLTDEERAVPSRSHGIAITPDDREVWSVSTLHGVLYAHDATVAPARMIARIPLSERGHPEWVAFAPDGTFGYVSLPNTDQIAVIDVASHSLVTLIQLPAGTRPKTIEAVAVPRTQTAQTADLPTSQRSKRSNTISAEKDAIAPGLLPSLMGLTYAQTMQSGRIVTLLVAAYQGDTIEAVDLTALGAAADVDVFEASQAVGQERLMAALSEVGLHARYSVSDLLPSSAMYDRHLATGTNFAEHATETGSSGVFNFPKFGMPTPAHSTLVVHGGTLMDYEVEICVRFDRDIRTVADFEAARKGFFLCGDFTDRATLLRLIDPKNVTSGRGFSDAKSGPGYFPTGPFLVVPNDWRQFVRDERMVTRVNGEVRQDARGGEMILDFEALVAKALTNAGGGHYTYQGKEVPLAENNTIARGSALMSGTSEGVIFMPPALGDKIGGAMQHIFLGRFLSGKSLIESVIHRFIKTELEAGRYLKAGDRVEHLSSDMGALQVELVAP
jgi:YVTN family beta-propeller protein